MTLAERLRALIESHRMPDAGRLPLAPTPRAQHDIRGDSTRTSWAHRRTRQARSQGRWRRSVKRAWLDGVTP